MKWTHLDLTCSGETNGIKFELYALLGEVYGSGCPLGYLLLQSNGSGSAGGKERYITKLLTYLKDNWCISPVATLSDKDWSEINALSKVFPDAKYQLCFWHVLRAIKKRLPILRRRPRYYDVKEAIKEFDFIDKRFVPVAQLQEKIQCVFLYVPWLLLILF